MISHLSGQQIVYDFSIVTEIRFDKSLFVLVIVSSYSSNSHSSFIFKYRINNIFSNSRSDLVPMLRPILGNKIAAISQIGRASCRKRVEDSEVDGESRENR